MHARCLVVAALIAAPACSSKREDRPPPPAPVVAPDTLPIDAAPPDAARPPPPPASTVVGEVPPIAGPVTPIAEKQTVDAGGIAITFVSAQHKTGKGPALGRWQFTFARDGATQVIDLSSTQEHFEAEVAARGAFFVLRHVSYTKFEIVLAAAAAPAPLDEATCGARIEAAVGAAGLARGKAASRITHDGIVEYVDPGEHWIGHCGTLSERVWFTGE